MIQYNFPTTMFYGPDSIKDLPSSVKEKNINRILLVTDSGIVQAGLAEKLLNTFNNWDISIKTYDSVHANPIEEDVTNGVNAFQGQDCEALIALGGGSALDVAKTIRFMVVHEPPLAQYDDNLGGDKKIIHPLPAMYAIPTTAGTGSEVGRSSVITMSQTKKKTIFFHPDLLPDIAILDPLLTVSLPSHITAATGIDAFTHCMEAYLVDNFHPMADAIACKGMEMIINNLPKVINNPNDLDARGQMLLAASMGATAFQKGLGMIHSMAHPLSAEFNIHHGLANALIIKFALGFTINKASESNNKTLLKKLTTIGNIISENKFYEIHDIIEIMDVFLKNIGITLGLTKQGIKLDDINKLATLSSEDSCHATHPFPVDRENFIEVYTQAL